MHQSVSLQKSLRFDIIGSSIPRLKGADLTSNSRSFYRCKHECLVFLISRTILIIKKTLVIIRSRIHQRISDVSYEIELITEYSMDSEGLIE